MSYSDSDEEYHKFEFYESALKDSKNDINKLLKKKKDINYTKIVYENLVYDPDDPDEGIKKEDIEDLRKRMIVELKVFYKASYERKSTKKKI